MPETYYCSHCEHGHSTATARGVRHLRWKHGAKIEESKPVSLEQCQGDELHDMVVRLNNLRVYLETVHDGHLPKNWRNRQ